MVGAPLSPPLRVQVPIGLKESTEDERIEQSQCRYQSSVRKAGSLVPSGPDSCHCVFARLKTGAASRAHALTLLRWCSRAKLLASSTACLSDLRCVYTHTHKKIHKQTGNSHKKSLLLLNLVRLLPNFPVHLSIPAAQ